VIAPRPDLLLLDEPFSGLDFENRKKLLDLLSEYSRNCGTAVMIVSHDPLPDPYWADRSLILKAGKIRDA
jgi:ABC-type Mn2+/Zn2+ transport system ATPase subunit